MGALDSIIHPGLLDDLDAQGFFPDTGTVQSFTITKVEGEPTKNWADIPGLVDLDCAISPATTDERRSTDMTIALSTHKALLKGNYPTITAANRFVSGGVNYDICGPPEHDSQSYTTRLRLRLVKN